MFSFIKRKILTFILCWICIWLAGWQLFEFYFIARYGQVKKFEPNPFIMWTEITIFIAMIVFAIWFAIRTFSKRQTNG